jgi:hypothetical protein
MAEQRHIFPAIDAVRADGRHGVAVLTVIRVRRRAELIGGLTHWRRVQRDMRSLARQPLVVRRSVSLRTRELVFFSLWPDVRSLLLFNALGSHVRAVRWVIRGRHETWTSVFSAIGPADLSRGPGEPTWLDVLGQRASGQPDGAQFR